MITQRRLAIAFAILLAGCAREGPGGGFAAAGFRPDNPFANPSPLFDQAPPFDRIRDADLQPAMEEGMRRQLAEIDAIASDTAAPTFDNTIVAMERSGQLLSRVDKVFFGLTAANMDDTLQQVETDEAPRLAAHNDAIYLNPQLFQRVKRLYDERTSLGLDSVPQFLLWRYDQDFVRAGALLGDSDKTKLKALNLEESKLTTDFEKRLLAATKAGAVVVADSTQLAGLSAGEIAAAAQAAKDRGLAGKWVLPLQNTTQQPAQASLTNRALRQQLFAASTMRAEHNDSNDTRADIQRLAQLRAEKAKLLGYPNYAAYVEADQMAKTPAAVLKFMDQLVPATTAKADAEAKALQALIDKDGKHFTLKPWDWEDYSEKLRKAKYDSDENEIKPYFELHNVLRNGGFYAAHEL